ncbi:glucodextranase DOMON-like domain-containing protein [Halorhabdus amylolytica]|uniref:glucodextranase DOMON-like domain-containing protein n=1 Tax=Halorhabdus amylolytica TaxID=2559573 RepID=UPI0010A9FD75|nr:glucodextranase DOMON-like domain-containing protein [Halorhabdus amylolytica]
MKRREYLTGLTGISTLSVAARQASGRTKARRLSSATEDDTHHPGPPRFGRVGVTFYDRWDTDFDEDHAGGKDRDNFAPRIVGDAERDPDNYSVEDFSWSLVETPEDSTAALEYRPDDDGRPQYDPGQDNVVEFAPDVPGTYVLELDAPDGIHEQLLYIFPEHGDAGSPPRISIDGHYDNETDEFVLESNPRLAPKSKMAESDLIVEWLADGRDALSTGDIVVGDGIDSWTARIPKSALGGETGRVHAAPWDTNAHGYTDTVTLDPANEVVEYPNRPPEWIENGIIYQIFPRSFGGPPEESEWPLQNSNANFATFEEKLDYIEELNVDVIWFCPTVPSESANWKPQNADEWDGPDNRLKYVGGGPHGYDALSYFQTAEDLTSEYSVEDYKDEPWPWETGYDPDDNLREAARESAMAEFQSFMDAAHERDIRVCIDFVINHGGRHHPLFQDTIAEKTDSRPEGWTYRGIEKNNTDSKYFDWFTRTESAIKNEGEVIDAAPSTSGFAGLRVMPQWNYGNVALREHILAAAEHWAEMGVDAFRCDIAYGVPHSFWKEVRERVRDIDPEFMLLDETIPNDPNFAENEFDLHFDSADFMTSAGYGVVNGADPMELYNAVHRRKNEGWPDHALILNATENHDEYRLLDEALSGSREDPAKAQRAVWSAGVTLTGVPFIYYGQERLLSKYGEERYDYDDSGEDYRTDDGDVGPGNPARAFMNWETNDEVEDHLQFYQDVTQFYKETEILKPSAGLRKTWFRSDDSVLVFGRSMETDDGRKNVVVMHHFDPGTAQVDLLPGTETTDLFTGEDIGVDSGGPAVSVAFDTLAVVETDTLFSVGEQIVQIDDPTGDDNGPGSYTYPTGDAYTDGVFDVSELTVHTTTNAVQFRVTLDGNLSNPDGYDGGITAQHLQVYIRDPNADAGTTDGRTGTNVIFEKPYQYRLIADGENGARVEDHEGNVVAEGSITTNKVTDGIVVEIPTSVLSAGIRSYCVAPLMLGYHPDADGGVMPVQAEASSDAFGGADPAEEVPAVIDMVTPEPVDQADVLSYSEVETPTLPYTSLTPEFEPLGLAEDADGDDHGPGNYQHPTADSYDDNPWDITSVEIAESRSRVEFTYNFATEVQNPWRLDGGFSHQHMQVYIRDPDAGVDAPTATVARKGINAEFVEPYHYRIAVHGQGLKQVENGAGDVVSTDVNVAVEGTAISFDVPMEAIDGSPEGKQIASLVTSFDGYGTGGVRTDYAEKPDSHVIGTDGQPVDNAPHVLDMIPPTGTDQSEALAYSKDEMAEIPLADWGRYNPTG